VCKFVQMNITYRYLRIHCWLLRTKKDSTSVYNVCVAFRLSLTKGKNPYMLPGYKYSLLDGVFYNLCLPHMGGIIQERCVLQP